VDVEGLEGLFTKSYSEPAEKRALFDRLVADGVVCFREIRVSAPPASPALNRGLEQGKDEHAALCRAAAHWVESLGKNWRPQERYPGIYSDTRSGLRCDVATDEILIECGKTQKQKVPALLTALPGARLVVFPPDRHGTGIEFFVPQEKRQDALNWGRAVSLGDVYYSVKDPCIHCVNSVKALSLEYRYDLGFLHPEPEMADGRLRIKNAPGRIVVSVLAIQSMPESWGFCFGATALNLRIPGHDHEALINSNRRRALALAKDGVERAIEAALDFDVARTELLEILSKAAEGLLDPKAQASWSGAS